MTIARNEEQFSKLAGSRWFHKVTGVEHMVALLPHDYLTMIIDIENGKTVFWDEFGDAAILAELNLNYEQVN